MEKRTRGETIFARSGRRLINNATRLRYACVRLPQARSWTIVKKEQAVEHKAFLGHVLMEALVLAFDARTVLLSWSFTARKRGVACARVYSFFNLLFLSIRIIFSYPLSSWFYFNIALKRAQRINIFIESWNRSFTKENLQSIVKLSRFLRFFKIL